MKHLFINFISRFYTIFNLFFNSICVPSHTITNEGKVLFKCKIRCKGKGNRIVFKKGGIIRNTSIVIYGNDNLIIVDEDASINCGDVVIEDNNNNIQIGKRTHLCGSVHLACTEGSAISIGNDCLFSSEITLRTGDSHSILNAASARINHARDIQICNHVWICYRVLITKGALISENSVVGTGSVVTRQFSTPNVVIAGVPATVIKENINWCAERIAEVEEVSS